MLCGPLAGLPLGTGVITLQEVNEHLALANDGVRAESVEPQLELALSLHDKVLLEVALERLVGQRRDADVRVLLFQAVVQPVEVVVAAANALWKLFRLDLVGDEGLDAVVLLVDVVVDDRDGVGRAASLPQRLTVVVQLQKTDDMVRVNDCVICQVR